MKNDGVTVVIRDGTVEVVASDGVIVSVGGVAASESVSNAAVLDASGCHVLAGFIDLQMNGAVGVDLTSEPHRVAEVAEFLASCGVTSFQPTVISSDEAQTRHAIDVLGQWREHGNAGSGQARSLGVHLEGPFLEQSRRGAHPPQHLRPPSIAEVTSWVTAGAVSMVTLAPESPGAIDVIRTLVAAGVVVSAGHTAMTADALNEAAEAGLSGATHLFNAMGTMSARSPGPAGAVLDHGSLIAGLIADGVHVGAAMVRLAWRVLGPDRIALVTDAMAATGLGDGHYVVGDTDVVVSGAAARTRDGVLAGGVMPSDAAVRNLIAITGCTLAEASRAASSTPARWLGRGDVGRLAVGLRADVVLLDEQLAVVATVIDGQVAYDPQRRLHGRS